MGDVLKPLCWDDSANSLVNIMADEPVIPLARVGVPWIEVANGTSVILNPPSCLRSYSSAWPGNNAWYGFRNHANTEFEDPADLALWAPATGDTSPWMQIDLGSVANVSGIRLEPRDHSQCVHTYSVATSLNNIMWTSNITFSDLWNASTKCAADPSSEERYFDPRRARYVKIFVPPFSATGDFTGYPSVGFVAVHVDSAPDQTSPTTSSDAYIEIETLEVPVDQAQGKQCSRVVAPPDCLFSWSSFQTDDIPNAPDTSFPSLNSVGCWSPDQLCHTPSPLFPLILH